MTTVTVASEISAPIARVFEVFTDLEHSADRVSNIRRVEPLTVGGIRLGSRWLETREMFGRHDTVEMQVTAFERNRTYTITHHRAGARIDAIFRFHPIENRTKVKVEFVLGSHGLPPGSLVPVQWAIANKVRSVIGQDLADLKAFIEGRSRTEPEEDPTIDHVAVAPLTTSDDTEGG